MKVYVAENRKVGYDERWVIVAVSDDKERVFAKAKEEANKWADVVRVRTFDTETGPVQGEDSIVWTGSYEEDKEGNGYYREAVVEQRSPRNEEYFKETEIG